MRVLLPNQRGLLTFLVRSMIDETPVLQVRNHSASPIARSRVRNSTDGWGGESQRPAVCALFQMTLPPQCREIIAATPMCVPALLSLCRSEDEVRGCVWFVVADANHVAVSLLTLFASIRGGDRAV